MQKRASLAPVRALSERASRDYLFNWRSDHPTTFTTFSSNEQGKLAGDRHAVEGVPRNIIMGSIEFVKARQERGQLAHMR